jgi:hypothetical protein
MAQLRDAGLAVDLPPGWDARIYRRAEVAAASLHAQGEPTTHAIMHAANFALPAERGDFGSGAVELMRRDNVLIALVEYHPSSAGSPMFATPGLPRPLRADDFDPAMLQRRISGQAGVQRFFSSAGRAFALYVVLGSYADRRRLVASVNEVLAGIVLGPRP